MFGDPEAIMTIRLVGIYVRPLWEGSYRLKTIASWRSRIRRSERSADATCGATATLTRKVRVYGVMYN
jgi:hypothetical protein